MINILIITIAVILAVTICYQLIKKLLKNYLLKDENYLSSVNKLRRSLLFPSLVIYIKLLLPLFKLPEFWLKITETTTSILIIVSMCILFLQVMDIAKIIIMEKFDISEKNNLKARKIHTQVKVIQRIITVLIVFIALVSIFMYFEKVRQLGASLLASAGVIGIILGFAAQKSIATIFAGLQIAITQPIRIDDVVIVEGEWGWIEEITLTYVVVRIWDLRRLIVPITYFLDKSFQNWTRTSADLLNTVFIYSDYSIPVEEIRLKLKEILDKTHLWDKKAWCLQVTNAKEQTLELRALMSSANSSNGWDLRCHVREELIKYISENFKDRLPLIRLEKRSS